MKSSIWLVVFIAVLLFATSCGGVAQDKYDKAVKDLTATQAQIQQIQSDLSAKQTELKDANDTLAKAKAEVVVLNTILLPSITGELNQMSNNEMLNTFLKWRDVVSKTNNDTLLAKFQSIIDSEGSEQSTIEFFQYLLQDIAKTLQ